MSGTATCKDVVQCVFSLGDIELKILKRLSRKGAARTDELAKWLRRDQSIIHRGLQKLMACGLVFKEKETIEQGGYFYIYTALPLAKIKKKVKQCIDEWHEGMTDALKDFDL